MIGTVTEQLPSVSEPSENTSGVGALLRAHAAVRRRTVDDHMFTVGQAAGVPCTFRLQLFTAPGHRSVAVATQTFGEGASLTNAAERYAMAVWRTHCPDETKPPIWIQHHLPGDDFELVTFTVEGPFTLRKPSWHHLTDDQLASLVGTRVDPDRGEGYIPHPEPAPDRLRYEIVPVADLPRPHPYRTTACMPPPGAWPRRLLARMRRPATGQRECCWYHAQDWAAASELAIRLIDHARQDGLADEDISTQIVERARALGADEAFLPALISLLSPATAIDARLGPDPSYTNGNHRARAMLDAGVERTVIVTYLPADAEA